MKEKQTEFRLVGRADYVSAGQKLWISKNVGSEIPERQLRKNQIFGQTFFSEKKVGYNDVP